MSPRKSVVRIDQNKTCNQDEDDDVPSAVGYAIIAGVLPVLGIITIKVEQGC
jgi:hypothetical protein